MNSDERYIIDPAYAKWRDEQDIIISKFFDYAYTPSEGSVPVEPS